MANLGFKHRNILLAVLFTVLIPATVYAQDRQTFTWNKPANYVTFNSITDNPKVGDERNFLLVRDVNSSTFADQLNVQSGQEIVLQIYFDNNAGSNLNLKAQNTRVRVNLQPSANKSATITAYIMANNANPKTVSDTSVLSSDRDFSLAYEKGSAQIWNNTLRGNKLSDDINSQAGALIGYGKLDGIIQGGAQYSGYVTLKIKVGSVAAGSTNVPNSGPGNVIALIALATLLGAAAHIRVISRR
jgi:hypothetical protein